MILDGKKASKDLFSKLKSNIPEVNRKLAVVQVGENPASTTYIKLKKKKSREIGIGFEHVKLESDVNNEDVLSIIQKLNDNTEIGGIILQLPLPPHLEKQRLLDSISLTKDIDCLSSEALGLFFSGEGSLIPATANGILKLFEYYNIEVEGKDICMIGASNLVGKPLAVALTNLGATVTLCHIKTKDIIKFSSISDIVITAVGKPRFFTAKYFKEGQTVVDIGISKDTDGELYGDVDYEAVSELVENITPVPGGVGPMTIYGLMDNFVKLNS